MTQLLTFLFFIFTKKKITKPCKWVGWQNKKKNIISHCKAESFVW
jgi:hypothetical protein